MEHMLDCMHSIIRFPSQDGYDFYVMHSDLRNQDQVYIYEEILSEDVMVHFCYVDPEFFSQFPESNRYPKQIYYRIFAASFLPENLDRILYLDGDTLVINPLDSLYYKDLEDNYFFACTHVKKALNKLNQYRLGMEKESTYINSGVLLMNLDALREEQDIEEVTKFVKKKKYFLTLPDQDILTALYGEKIGILDTMKYNLSDRMIAIYNAELNHEKVDEKWVRENAVILHYYGKQKPWNSTYLGILDVFYHEVRGKQRTIGNSSRYYI